MTALARRIIWQFLLIEVGILGYGLLLILPVYFGQSFGTDARVTDYVYWRTLSYFILPTAVIVVILHSGARWVRVMAFSASGVLALHFLWRAREIVIGSSHVTIGVWWTVLILLSISLCRSCWGWMTDRQPSE